MKISVRPSKKFLQLIELYGGPCRFAERRGIVTTTLIRFLDGESAMHGSTVATVLERTGLDYEDLFVHEEETAR